MGSFSKFIVLFALLITALNYAIAPAGLVTVDTNFFAWDANINIRGTGFTVDGNYALRITTLNGDMNYWSGKIPAGFAAATNLVDFNILDNNSTNRCDENVYNAISTIVSVKPAGSGIADVNGFYAWVPTIGATCLGNGTISFDVNAMVPRGIKRGVAFIHAHQVTAGATNPIPASSGPLTIFVTPYLVVLRPEAGGRAQNLLRPFGGRDTNIMIRGIGFARDENVTLKWQRFVPGTGWVITDLNLTRDGNGTVYAQDDNCLRAPTTPAGFPFCSLDNDRNAIGVDANRALGIGDGNYVMVKNNGVGTGTGNATLYPEGGLGTGSNWGYYMNKGESVILTGGFDVNITIPSTASLGGAAGDRLDANGTSSGDVNTFLNGADSNIHVFPSVTMTEADQNVVVGVTAAGQTTSGASATCSTASIVKYITIPQAMRDGNISDMNSVCNFVIRMTDANIAMNSGINMGMGPSRDFDSNMSGRSGQAGMDTDNMPEFKIDANITLFNVPSPMGTMPTLARDGFRCPINFCKNRNGTTPLTATSTDAQGQQTWVWNSVVKDGNMFFRVSSFSTYGTVTLDANLVSPNGGQLHRKGIDGNLTITFVWLDTNTSRDKRIATLYYSDSNISGYKVIVQDTNLLDFTGTGSDGNIGCTDADNNLATVNTCTYNWDANVPPGVYWIDLNLADWNGTNYLLDSSDNNITLNTPNIRFLGPSTAHNSIISGSGTIGDGRAHADGNIIFTLDFNMRYDYNINNRNANRLDDLNLFSVFVDQDNNRDNGFDANLYDTNRGWLIDLNMGRDTLKVGIPLCNTGGAGGLDGNVGPDANGADLNCHVDVNMSAIISNTAIRGEYYIGVDTNHWGTIYTARTTFIDNNRPVVSILRPLASTTYISGTYRIDFNISDADWRDYNKADGNFLFADIYYATDTNLWDGYGTLIANDLNLATRANCKQDTNLADQNSAVDANCSYNWSTTGVTDGNYYIVIDLNEGRAGKTGTDANVSAFTYVVDNSIPNASITYPPSGGATVTSQIIMTYTGSDTISGIKNYWVRIGDSGLYTNNGINLSYTFTGLTCGRQYTVYLIATNNADLNSATASQSFGTDSCGATGPSTGPSGSGPVGPTTTVTPTTETVTTDTTPYAPTPTVIESVIAEAFPTATAEELAATEEKANAAEELTNVVRDIQVVKSTSTSNVISYYSNISLKVENPGTKRLENVKVIEIIPKTVALSATEITSAYAFNILVADPVVEFIIPEIDPESTVSVTYTVQKQIDANAIASYKAPVVADLQEKEVSLCEAVDCDDTNPCTTDTCDEATGTCSNVAVADGTACGTGKDCQAGACTEIAPEAECAEDADCASGETCVDGACEAAGEAPAAPINWALIAVVIIIILGAAYYFLIMKKKRR